jgi:hypothetical protein
MNSLAPVIGMKATDTKRKLAQHRLQYRNQIRFANLPRRLFQIRLRVLMSALLTSRSRRSSSVIHGQDAFTP